MLWILQPLKLNFLLLDMALIKLLIFLAFLEFLLSQIYSTPLEESLTLHCICFKYTLHPCQVQFTLGWKSTEWTWKWVDLWNNLGFSLYAASSVYYVVTTSDDRKKSRMEVSADLVCHHWTPGIEFNKNYLHRLSD